MPTERWNKKMFTNKRTGTTPKTTQRNVGAGSNHPPDYQNHHFPNNLDWSWHRQPNPSRNLGRAAYDLNHPYFMETAVLEGRRQNDLIHLNMPAGHTNDGLSTSSSSVSNSHRDSLGTIPKCDNVKKCLDKKQIEDQLNQIREYLNATTSLMSSVKNNEDQHAIKEREQFAKMIQDLKNSEAKLLRLVNDPMFDNSTDGENEKELLENGADNLSDSNASGYQRNGLEQKVEFTNRKVKLLRDQQNALANLKRKAENQLSEMRHLTDENRIQSQQQQLNTQLRNGNVDQSRFADSQNLNNYNEHSFDPAIKDLEDRIAEMKNDSLRHLTSNCQENSADQSYLQERLESSNELMHLLESRDGQLSNEHMELQQKLNELQMKKSQIDQLAQQLQNLGEDEEEDIGNQVRKIVTMKQHLSSLKDLLEVVKNTEFSLLNSQNVNELEPETQENHQAVCTKTDNIRQNVRINLQNAPPCDQWINQKTSNKTLVGIQEREKVLAELKAKKRELEEIMYKQKDSASINNDVCSEISVNKSESSTNNNVFEASVMSWLPMHPHHHNQVASAYSSDDCPEEDGNDFSDLNSAMSIPIMHTQSVEPTLNATINMSKPRTESNTRARRSQSNDFVQHSLPITPDQRAKSMSTTGSGFEQERCSNVEEQNKNQVQRQLELIQQVCQSLLDQQSQQNPGNVQQLRNNLTPSPLYSEPRHNILPNQQVNAINYVNPPADNAYLYVQQMYPHLFAVNDLGNNHMLAGNTHQTQAFLLNTLNQCCQMLWFQQREIASLSNMICSIQDQMVNRHLDQEVCEIPSVNPYIFPSHPNVFRNVTPKINQVSSACSMPNLNPPGSHHANTEGAAAYSNQNNIRSSPAARLLDSSLNNLSNQNLISEHHANNTVLPNVNVSNMNHSLPAQIWNGQALNNQVAPGNRANNYWDNFRSYSRQNLLSASTKSNEVLQNPLTTERSNTIYDRAHSLPSSSQTPPKLNAVNASGENTPRRQLHFKTGQNTSNKSVAAAIPPDVLNINHNSASSLQKPNETVETANEVAPESVVPEAESIKEQTAEQARNPNEWRENEQPSTLPKSKLFEELRDNVYKEVANLISANENRPHFLIQLFRDLQHINSDSMRGKTLQSIQTVLTHSLPLETKRAANRQLAGTNAQGNVDQEISPADSTQIAGPPPSWLLQSAPKATPQDTTEKEDPINSILKPIVTFLNNHKDEIFHQELIEIFKALLIKSIPFTEIFANRNIQEQTFLKHFGIIFAESLEKFRGKRVVDVYKDVLKSVTDTLVGELSFIYLIQENMAEGACDMPQNGYHQNKQVENAPQMQNGDLAEADQTRLEQEEEVEGAVGGVLNEVADVLSSNTDQVGPDITDLPKLDFIIKTEPEVEFMEQGLDQVPTRLTTLRSNTPNRDRSSSRTDILDHY